MFSSVWQIPTGNNCRPDRARGSSRELLKIFSNTDQPTAGEFDRRCPSKVEKRRLIPEPKSVQTRWAILFFFLSLPPPAGPRGNTVSSSSFITATERLLFSLLTGRKGIFQLVLQTRCRAGQTGQRDRANPVRGIVKNELLGPRYYSVIRGGGPPPAPG